MGKKDFSNYSKAIEYATEHGKRLVFDYMADSEIEYDNVDIDVKRQDMTMDEDGGTPIETRMVFLGVGIPKTEDAVSAVEDSSQQSWKYPTLE